MLCYSYSSKPPFSNNIETGIWTTVITSGLGPSARFSVAGDCVDSKSGVLVFVGGCNENLEALDDMYYLDTGAIWLIKIH